MIGYIERDWREDGERVDAQLDSAGNPIAYVNRDARDCAVIDVKRVLADRKHFLTRVPHVSQSKRMTISRSNWKDRADT